MKWRVEIGGEFEQEFDELPDNVQAENEGKEITVATNVREKMKGFGADRRKKIEARAAELIAEELTLRDLRQALALTQESIAETLGIGQDGVSRLEKRSDLLLSTLRSYVAAMGGHLSLIAEFPNRDPVILSELSSIETGPRPAPRSPRRTRGRKAHS